MRCPAVPLEGLSEAMFGGPPGETAAVVGVEVEGAVVVGVVLDVVRCVPVPAGPVEGVREAGGLAGAEPAAVVDGGAEWPLNETTKAMAAATTSAPTTATEPTSQRLGRAAGPGSVSERKSPRGGHATQRPCAFQEADVPHGTDLLGAGCLIGLPRCWQGWGFR